MKESLPISRCSSTNVVVPAGFCAKLADALATLKAQLLAKYEASLPGQRQLVRGLIADAEALAWETSFPHLFLPDFAEARFEAALAREELSFAEAA